MSDADEGIDWIPDPLSEVNLSFEKWLEDHKDRLSRLGMPMVEDYIVVVAFRDMATHAAGGFATLKTRGSPQYRIRGLLEVALDFYSADPFDSGPSDV